MSMKEICFVWFKRILATGNLLLVVSFCDFGKLKQTDGGEWIFHLRLKENCSNGSYQIPSPYFFLPVARLSNVVAESHGGFLTLP